MILTPIKRPIFSIADMSSAYDQMSLEKLSQRLTVFVIAEQNNAPKDHSALFQSAQPLSHLHE